jgi:hypothetical protein
VYRKGTVYCVSEGYHVFCGSEGYNVFCIERIQCIMYRKDTMYRVSEGYNILCIGRTQCIVYLKDTMYFLSDSEVPSQETANK